MNTASAFEQHLAIWREQEMAAVELLSIAGELRFDKSVDLLMFRRVIYDNRPSEVINDHLYAKNYVNQPIDVHLSIALAKIIANLDLAPARIDLGKLALDWLKEQDASASLEEFVQDKLGYMIGDEAKRQHAVQHRDVVLYGFGRIGRLAIRRLIAMTGSGDQLRLRAIVIRPRLKDLEQEMHKRASLLRKDSVHGKFRGTVQIEDGGEHLVINGSKIRIICASEPEEIDYTSYGIHDALLIDSTGAWRDKESLSRHLRPGIEKVLFTAPGKGIPNIVYGVNHHTLDTDNEQIFCAASCTTNAISPGLKVLNGSIGVRNGHMETIHAYTSSQNILDNFDKKERRGRSAAVNLIITTTGADSAVGAVLPELQGKLTGSAIRVPVQDGSLAILTLNFDRATTVEEINEIMRQASLSADLIEQIDYSTSQELVSSDIIGSTAACIFDAPSTKISADGMTGTIYLWYDNEHGYTSQVLRLAKYASKVRRVRYY